MKYAVGTYIAFLSKSPQVHLNRMFGYNNLSEADFNESEHVGVIRNVLWNYPPDTCYQVHTIRPLAGFTCHVLENDILCVVNPNEL